MEELLKEKLWFYIIHNNPDLMFTLQEDYSVLDYLNEKINSVKSILNDMLSDGTPKYIIEEMDMQTKSREKVKLHFCN
ncbi:hypothetical protein [Flavobacterium sp. LM4]|uniref:hypothetical protein n=1 Tax=Flavobacterium sp. LM4 TaxID=1938609 RepID=UPI000993C70E|nr:hypothetical protein [Flavobacterium sp. LM4]OOV20483.1 hypothetical protein BXU10_13085 [Flavobacterium sp. LM4]